MSEDFLLKRQRAELATIIRVHGFKGSEFVVGPWLASEVGFDGSGDVYAVAYSSWSTYVFALRAVEEPGHYVVALHPGTISHRDRWTSQTWPQVLSLFGDWLQALRFELELPDAWSELTKLKFAAAAITPADNTPFTEEEQRYINSQLDRLLEDSQFTREQVTVIAADVNYLKQSAARSGRRDWGLMLLGTLLSWVGPVLPPQQVSEILRYHVQPLWHSLKYRLLNP